MRLRANMAGLAVTVAIVSICGCATGAAASPSAATPPAAAPRTAAPPAAAPRTAAPSPSTARPATATPLAARTIRTTRVTSATSSQLITVSAPSYGATRAELVAYQREDGQWHRVYGPWLAWIGRNGMAPPGAKREGDGRTPSGTFGFGFFFGVDPDPGVLFSYRRVHPYDFWDDDPSSPLYNEWVDDRYANAGAEPEPMDVSAYDYGAVIAYNLARAPGRGSAIFLHINIGMPTAGCVSLPAGELLEVLRWLNPAASPRITMGVGVRPPAV
jgi:L,D-peptidoglycan transpeptidase YkuD (ErfK/YbiS/YcfS/YnhG family)